MRYATFGCICSNNTVSPPTNPSLSFGGNGGASARCRWALASFLRSLFDSSVGSGPWAPAPRVQKERAARAQVYQDAPARLRVPPPPARRSFASLLASRFFSALASRFRAASSSSPRRGRPPRAGRRLPCLALVSWAWRRRAMVHKLGVRHPARGVGGSQKVELWKLRAPGWRGQRPTSREERL